MCQPSSLIHLNATTGLLGKDAARQHKDERAERDESVDSASRVGDGVRLHFHHSSSSQAGAVVLRICESLTT